MSTRPIAVCYGEILWDVLPGGAMPGGAPMNVAYHLAKLGVDAQLISRVGDDEPGKKLMEILSSWQLSTGYCQIDRAHKTSEVLAVVGENHEVKYDIVYPVAWDFIAFEDRLQPLVMAADALVFGSLVTRNRESAETLRKLVEAARYKVFDINLRPPYYSPAELKEFLQQTSLLKLNAAELLEVAGWYDNRVESGEDAIKFLQDEFLIDEIVITRGSKGASYHTATGSFDCSAYRVTVADTVGSGDSFLAAFLSKRLTGAEPDTALQFASAVAAFVTEHHGACPEYTREDIEKFRASRTAAES